MTGGPERSSSWTTKLPEQYRANHFYAVDFDKIPLPYNFIIVISTCNAIFHYFITTLSSQNITQIVTIPASINAQIAIVFFLQLISNICYCQKSFTGHFIRKCIQQFNIFIECLWVNNLNRNKKL